MLRANYRVENGNVIQEVLPLNSRVCEINEVEIDEDLDGNIKEIVINAMNSLDVYSNLMEIHLIHHDAKSYLVFVLHHLIIDGVSWNVLLDDLTHIYNSLLQDNELDIRRPYPYKNWVEDVKNLVENISKDEKEQWIEVNNLLDDSSIKGESKMYSFSVDVSFDTDNLLMLSEEEYLALSIARAYKKTYGKDSRCFMNSRMVYQPISYSSKCKQQI